jgi:hypothetical protein
VSAPRPAAGSVPRPVARPVARAAPRVDVVVGTFNGERFLREQLDSIAAQDGVEWRVIVRDDGSSDGTLSIVDGFAREYPGCVHVLDDGQPGLGAARSFGRLLEATTAPYVVTCDQDDVWAPRKVLTSLEGVRELEDRSGSAREILVHTDLRVVDAQRRPLAASLNRFQRLGAERRTGLRHLLVQNAVTGCTMALNRALLQRALPVPSEAIMHDWWLALVAAAFGTVSYLPEATVDYRQHGANAIGARRFGLARRPSTASMRQSLDRTFEQADALHRRFACQMGPDEAAVVEAYARLPNLSGARRRWRIARHGFWKHGFARNVALLVVV